jgi:hypothetical protein
VPRWLLPSAAHHSNAAQSSLLEGSPHQRCQHPSSSITDNCCNTLPSVEATRSLEEDAGQEGGPPFFLCPANFWKRDPRVVLSGSSQGLRGWYVRDVSHDKHYEGAHSHWGRFIPPHSLGSGPEKLLSARDLQPAPRTSGRITRGAITANDAFGGRCRTFSSGKDHVEVHARGTPSEVLRGCDCDSEHDRKHKAPPLAPLNAAAQGLGPSTASGGGALQNHKRRQQREGRGKGAADRPCRWGPARWPTNAPAGTATGAVSARMMIDIGQWRRKLKLARAGWEQQDSLLPS